MDTLTDIAEFTSSGVSPRLPDSCQVNPEVYGAELAFWLSSELAAIGVVTSYPRSEDWGWYIEFETPSGSEFAVHCGNVGGARDRWFLQLRRFGRKLFGRDKPAFSEAEDVIRGIERVLAESPDVSELDWRYSDDCARS